MGVRWNEQLNSWIVEPEEGKKFETKNVLKTIPHRGWYQDFVKDWIEPIGEAELRKGESYVALGSEIPSALNKAGSALGKGMSFAGQEYLVGLPPGGKYGPWIREGLTKQEYEERNKEIRIKEGLPLLTADQDKTKTTDAKVNPADAEQDKISNLSSIQNIPTGFKTKAGSKVTKSYTPDQMKEWEEKGGDMTPDDYFSRKHFQDSGKNIEWSTDQKTNEGFTFQQNAKTNDELKPKFGKDGTVTKNLQIASAVLEGLQKLQPKKESVNINWSNPYDEDNIRGYTGTWA